jgi:D-3-phosphoglycerate dehydrogenase
VIETVDKFRVALSGDFRNPDGSPKFPVFDLTALEQNDRVEFEYIQPQDGAMTAAALENFDALILLTAKFSAASVPTGGRLAVVARFGVGYDTVDLDVCNANAISVVITPDGVRRPVAVSVITLILALAGNLMTKNDLTRQGPDGWARVNQHMGIGLIGRTLGSLGIGNIGAEVYRMARPFDMQFIAHDPYVDANLARELSVELVDLDELFVRSDFLSVSCPLNEETRGIVNAERLARMKPSAYLINSSRGPVVDQAALTKALQDKQIAGAGLDVFEQEPTSADDPIFSLDNVITTPHSLCWTDQCFAGIGAADVKATLAVMAGEVPRGIVNSEITQNPAWLAKLEACRMRFGTSG